jgi:hypothetical protein
LTVEPSVPKLPTCLPGEIWGVSCYFNPTGSPVLRENVRLFSQDVRSQGLKLLIVELAFGGAPFEIDGGLGDMVIRRRSDTVLWQKERLLNLGIKHLPATCDKVIWLDADILFENSSWVEETRSLLQSYVVIQPYRTACWLSPGCRTAPESLPRGLGEGHSMPGMAFTLAGHPDRRRALADYFEHGHSGFAWAARREVLDSHGLYDRRILGGGDIVIAHSLYGDTDFWRGLNFYCRQMTGKELACVADWGRRIYEDVGGSVFYVDGRVLHLWHGSVARRDYLDRQKILKENDYDPNIDVALDAGECWRWNSTKPDLHCRARAYFAARGGESEQ